MAGPVEQPAAAGWTLGEPRLDHRLGPRGLELGAVHELKPAGAGAGWPAAWGAARTFALMLAVRRLQIGDQAIRAAPILWCTTAAMAAEHGMPYGPGLRALGLDPARLVLVEPMRTADVLWALEEGLRSGAPGVVVGQVDDLALTPARRLALAAADARTPCLVLTHPAAPPAAATASRWRIGASPAAPHPLVPSAPGASRLTLAIERCRNRPRAADGDSADRGVV